MKFSACSMMAVATASAILGASAGCSGPRPPAGAMPDPVTQNIYPAITVDGALQNFVAVDYPRIIADQPMADSPLNVRVPLRSQSDTDMTVQTQFTWYDAQGRQVGESGWRTVTLPSRRQVQLGAHAIVKEATQWRLDVRAAR